jgi:phosphoribosylamine--glycine ligase
MNILVIGSGGREHAICWSFAKSSRVSQIFCAPGNAGIAEIARCVPINAEDIGVLAEFAAENKIDLTFVGGESALALGIVDEFESRGLRIVGASKEAAQLEASKAFAKDFMKRHGVPTAEFAISASAAEAVSILNSGTFGGPESAVVVKADGLAAGKGVVVAADRAEAIAAVNDLKTIAGTEAASRIVLEECLGGGEVSLLMFADGEDFALMPPARDYKRIGEGDTGPNTGGMGTITDASLLTEDHLDEITETIIRPTLRGCIAEGFPFRGILFLGLMMTYTGQYRVGASNPKTPKLLEYNVRFGDPETQSILVRLETDLVAICEAIIEGRLEDIDIDWKPGSSATVVLAAEGYPQHPRKGDSISGLETASSLPGVNIFHAGTSNNGGTFVTNGGRVLGVTAVGESLETALGKAYSAAETVSWRGVQYRRDIGKTVSLAELRRL